MNKLDMSFPPNVLTLISTYNCNAACYNCCFQCSPHRKERLSLDEMISIVNFVANEFQSLKIVIITGGEPMMLGEDVFEIIKHITSLNKFSRIITNAHWATTFEAAYNVIKRLKDCGLTEINYSTGDEHQCYVKYDNIVYAIMAGLENGLPIAVNVESNENKIFKSSIIYNDPRLSKYFNSASLYPKLTILDGSWLELNNEKDVIEEIEKETLDNNIKPYNPCSSMLGNICITPDMEYLSCCGFGALKNKYLNFGKVNTDNILKNYNHQFDDLLKIWLYVDGPTKIAQFINKYSGYELIKYKGLHSCKICNTILSSNKCRQIIKENIHYEYSNIILKYNLSKISH